MTCSLPRFLDQALAPAAPGPWSDAREAAGRPGREGGAERKETSKPPVVKNHRPVGSGAWAAFVLATLLCLPSAVRAQGQGTDGWTTAAAAYQCLRDFSVSPSGSDDLPGTAAAPWRTVSHALSADHRAGDCITLEDGTYTEAITWSENGGSTDEATGYVVLRAENQHGSRLRPPPGAYSTLTIRSSYVVVDGLDVIGGEGHGIDIEDAHHVKVLRSRVHDSGGSGISAWKGEFYLFEGNLVFGNAATNGYQGSGISIYQARAVSGMEASPGFRNIVRGNVSFGNIEGPAIPEPHTDGNGIIIDDFQHTQTEGHPAYPFPTLVENNLVFGNGGKGIQVTWSDHVTVRNNTAFHNNHDDLNPGTWRAELSNAQSSFNVWANNLAVSDAGINPNNTALDDVSYDGYVNRDVVWSGNLGFGSDPAGMLVRTDGGNPGPSGGNLLGVDPLLRAPGLEVGADFRLQPSSPAIDAGTEAFGLAPTDLDGHQRVTGPQVDLGAYEHQGLPATPSVPSLALTDD